MNIIVTGASKGIGFEVCRRFLQEKTHNVIAISRSGSQFESDKLFQNNIRFKFIPLDLTTADFNLDLIPTISKLHRNIDIIINNAGLLINKPFSELSDEDFDEMFNVNVKSVFRLIRDLLPVMNKNAHIVNMSSMGGFQGSSKFPGLSLYSSSKGALSILSECIAEEFKDLQISSNALAIGAVQTEMLNKAFPGYVAPLKPNEMAEFIYDFALNGSKFFNGKVLPVSLSTP